MVDLHNILRNATEDDVALALHRSYIRTPLSDPAELVEFFNRMMDVITGEDDAAEFADEAIIDLAATMRP